MTVDEEMRLNIFKNITCILLKLGFQANQRGYRFLREAVWIAYEDSETVTCVTKLLYPEVAKRFHTNDKQVERAIRNAIETAWTKGNKQQLFELFDESYMEEDIRPTNTEVVMRLVQCLDQENDEYDERIEDDTG